MYYVYIIQSQKNNSYYIGSTGDLKIRFKQHQQGQVSSTKPFRPYSLVYYEAYKFEKTARIRELQLKRQRIAKEEIIKRINKAPSSSG